MKQMGEQVAGFLALCQASSQQELERRLLYLRTQSIESENSENKERLDAMNRCTPQV